MAVGHFPEKGGDADRRRALGSVLGVTADWLMEEIENIKGSMQKNSRVCLKTVNTPKVRAFFRLSGTVFS
ncbi:hypothetical protein [Pseudoflavonifractor sp. 524-17]|uniref:hypothetical protein n=1 Tax=Pseudoflavonifractor sp. 524-17 TaxID=2304577 RepID=UPI00137B8C81|nr:hypothetical protein [Pseudoflavonifractor sp. 524-17]